MNVLDLCCARPTRASCSRPPRAAAADCRRCPSCTSRCTSGRQGPLSRPRRARAPRSRTRCSSTSSCSAAPAPATTTATSTRGTTSRRTPSTPRSTCSRRSRVTEHGGDHAASRRVRRRRRRRDGARAIRAIGRAALVPKSADPVYEKLIELLDLEIEYVRAETVLALKDLLRKYPERRGPVLPTLARLLRGENEPAGKAAVLWIVGEWGEEVPLAPYLLEPLIDGYADEPDAGVRLALLTATTKLFFSGREAHAMLARLLHAATNDTTSQDVHDRARCARLLRASVDVGAPASSRRRDRDGGRGRPGGARGGAARALPARGRRGGLRGGARQHAARGALRRVQHARRRLREEPRQFMRPTSWPPRRGTAGGGRGRCGGRPRRRARAVPAPTPAARPRAATATAAAARATAMTRDGARRLHRRAAGRGARRAGCRPRWTRRPPATRCRPRARLARRRRGRRARAAAAARGGRPARRRRRPRAAARAAARRRARRRRRRLLSAARAPRARRARARPRPAAQDGPRDLPERVGAARRASARRGVRVAIDAGASAQPLDAALGARRCATIASGRGRRLDQDLLLRAGRGEQARLHRTGARRARARPPPPPPPRGGARDAHSAHPFRALRSSRARSSSTARRRPSSS